MLCRQAHGKILVAPLSRKYHWVYKDGESGYDNKRIEEKFIRLSKGGSVDLDTRGDASVVTIRNPTKRNAFTGTMIVALREVVNKLRHCERSKAVVLCGEGSAFCSGLDLGLATKLGSLEDGMDMCMYMQNTLTAFQLLPKITVAAVRGPALGGGAEIVTAADFRLMWPDSKIQFVQKNMGITPGWGGASRLRQIIGRRKAMHLLASSEALDCKSALLIGLADALASDFPDLSAAHGALEWMEKSFHLSDTDGTVFAAIKASTSISKTSDDDDHPLYLNLRREKDVLASVWGKPPNQKALDNVRLKQNS